MSEKALISSLALNIGRGACEFIDENGRDGSGHDRDGIKKTAGQPVIAFN
jgi:hypothetical protein